MMEIILFNEINTPVGASSELLMSESLSRSFKRFVQTLNHQMFLRGLMNL